MVEIMGKGRFNYRRGLNGPAANNITDKYGYRVDAFTAEQVEDVVYAVVHGLAMGADWGDAEVCLAETIRRVMRDGGLL